jgi:hypothetical protein
MGGLNPFDIDFIKKIPITEGLLKGYNFITSKVDGFKM